MALECYFKVLSIKSKAHEKEGMSISFSNIGISYKAKGDLDSAMLYYNKALVMYIELHDFKGQSHTMSTLGNLHLKKENFSKAKKYFSGALDIQIEQGDLGGQMFTHLGLASLSNARKEIDQGLHHAKLGLKISRGIGVVKEEISFNKILAKLYKNNGEFEKSLSYQESYTTLKDSIFNLESEKQVLEIQSKYDTEKKEKKLAEQKVLLAQKEIKLKMEEYKLLFWYLEF